MSILSSCFARSAALVLAAAPLAGAQQSWYPFLGLGSAPSSGPLPLDPGASALVIEPGALIQSPRGSMLARWSAPVSPSALQLTDADVAMRVRLQQIRGLESSVFATGRYDHSSAVSAAAATSALRLQLGTPSGTRGFQFGAGMDGWRSSINGNAVVVPATTISGWIRRFGLSFSAEVSARVLPGSQTASGAIKVDTAQAGSARLTPGGSSFALADTGITPFPSPGPRPGPDPGPSTPTSSLVSGGHAFGDATLRVSGMLMSFGLDGRAGVDVASGGRTRGFGSLILTRWIAPGFAFTGGLVVQPPEPGSTGGRTGALFGIRLAPGPHLFPHFVNAPKVGASSCHVRVADGATTIEVRAPAAGRVELSGDFTHWNPAVLERAGGDRWVLTTRLAPGVHRFVVRVDGGTWLPAPGLPQSVDAYEGTVSVIVAP